MERSEMGAGEARRQCDAPLSRIQGRSFAAFDFDGTLTITDTFTAFLRWRRGGLAYALGVLALLPALAAFLRRRDVERLKAAAVRVFLGGRTAEEVAAEAEAFAAARMGALMRPDAMRAWAAEGALGRARLIVTASPELVIGPFARRLGADALIGTRLEVDGAGRLTGALDGRNCRGPEKVRRLEAAFGADLDLKAAYGDTDGDRELLQRAETAGYRVFTARPPAEGGRPGEPAP